LLQRFKTATRTILAHPFIGRPSDIKDIRVLPIGDYLLFYEAFSDIIVVHHIWDGRRDLKKMKF
jgi:plasmid stabilization system protein ParE